MGTNELGRPVRGRRQGWAVREQPSVRGLWGATALWSGSTRCGTRRTCSRPTGTTGAARAGRTCRTGRSPTSASYRRWVERVAADVDPQFYAVVDTDAAAGTSGVGQAVGVLSLMRVDPEVGSIEVGHVHYSPLLQRRRAATEAHYLLMRYVFQRPRFGVPALRMEMRRGLNAPSRGGGRAAGVHLRGNLPTIGVLVKGRNRDTAWYSLIDVEWPQLSDRLQSWLAPDNFDDAGRQKSSLQLPDPSR